MNVMIGFVRMKNPQLKRSTPIKINRCTLPLEALLILIADMERQKHLC